MTLSFACKVLLHASLRVPLLVGRTSKNYNEVATFRKALHRTHMCDRQCHSVAFPFLWLSLGAELLEGGGSDEVDLKVNTPHSGDRKEYAFEENWNQSLPLFAQKSKSTISLDCRYKKNILCSIYILDCARYLAGFQEYKF